MAALGAGAGVEGLATCPAAGRAGDAGDEGGRAAVVVVDGRGCSGLVLEPVATAGRGASAGRTAGEGLVVALR